MKRNIKKTCKVMSTILCLMLLAGCSKEETKPVEKTDDVKVSTEGDFIESAELTDDGLFKISLKSAGSAEEAYLQMRAICNEKSKDNVETEAGVTDYNNEVFLRSLNYAEDIEVEKSEVEERIATQKVAQYPDESKYECEYDIQIKSVKSVDEEWVISEWETVFKDVKIEIDFESEELERVIEQRNFDVLRFVDELKWFAEENDVEGFMMNCEFPVLVNGEEYERFDFDKKNIITNEFIESIKSTNKENVSTENNKYILSGSGENAPKVTFEYIEERFRITEINF